MSKTELSLQDLPVNLDEITELQDSSVFQVEQTRLVPFVNEADLIQGFQIEMNQDLTIIERTGYTILDIFSDVGGLQGILVSAITMLLNLWNYNHLNAYILAKLFTVRNGSQV